MDPINPRPDPSGGRPLVFAHVGDLHLTSAEDHNARDLRAILAQLAALPRVAGHAALDFVYLPGDIAEDGHADQYEVISAVLGKPVLPIRLICGDHDRQYGKLEHFAAFFHTLVPPEDLAHPGSFHYAETIAGVRCLFVDMCSAGHGSKAHGLDFRLGREQLDWLADEIAEASKDRLPCAVFAHTYPADLTPPAERADFAGLLRAGGVRLVEMGHTHYNELAHDGVTAFAAARSVGQNEDGSVGYAIAALDSGVVSWRFKPLDRTWPFVLITSPADRRLATQAGSADTIEVRALVFGGGVVTRCQCRADNGFWVDMHRPDGDRCYTAQLPWPPGATRLFVRAYDGRWSEEHPHDYVDVDVIEPAGPDWASPDRTGCVDGSDDHRLGAWLEKGVRGDQLGPNRQGRPW